MKKALVAMFSILFLLGIAGAVSTDLKANYEKGETIIAEIKGNFAEPIAKEQVDFLRGHVSVPFDYDFKRLGDRYFLWAITPLNENNYTLAIKDISVNVAGKIEKINFEQNFSVSGNLSDYSIKPGFISTRENFEVNAQLNEDMGKIISINLPNAREIALKPGKNIIKFFIGDFNETGFLKVNIGKYAFPIYIIGKENNTSITKKNIILKFEPEKIESRIIAGEKIIYPFQIFNIGNISAENIELDYNKNLFFIGFKENSIMPGKAIELNFTLNEISEEIKKTGINEIIYANSGGFSFGMPVVINFTEKKEEVTTPYLKNYTKLIYCSELDGKVCIANEICKGESKKSLDGDCCLASCGKADEGGGSSWIGWVIAGIILIIIVYVFLRYRKAKTSKGFEKAVADAEKMR